MASYRLMKWSINRTKTSHGAFGDGNSDNLFDALKSIPTVNYNAEHQTATRNIAKELDIPLHEDGQLVKFYDKAVELGAWIFAFTDITESDNDWSSTITFYHYFPTDSAYDTWFSWINAAMEEDGVPFIYGTPDNRAGNGSMIDMGTVDFNKAYRS